jgi:hypothetical protein
MLTWKMEQEVREYKGHLEAGKDKHVFFRELVE